MDTFYKVLLTLFVVFPWSAVILFIWVYFNKKGE